MTDLPKYRRDYTVEELDPRPLIMLRSFAPSTVVWSGRRPMTLQDYLDDRFRRHQDETKR